MRRNELDYILGTMLDSHKDVSDLNIHGRQAAAGRDLRPT